MKLFLLSWLIIVEIVVEVDSVIAVAVVDFVAAGRPVAVDPVVAVPQSLVQRCEALVL